MARITVLAGTDGAGKSSIAGAALRAAGGEYFNPDEVTSQMRETNPGMSQEQANALAWQENVRRLRAAIAQRSNYAFETTLGGNTITGLLQQAAAAGIDVAIWYCGLDSPERHIQRAQARVAAGGHGIPENKIRERYDSSRKHLLDLMPDLATLKVYDNSTESTPVRGQQPSPTLLLEVGNQVVRYPLAVDEIKATPDWAKALVARAHQLWVKR